MNLTKLTLFKVSPPGSIGFASRVNVVYGEQMCADDTSHRQLRSLPLAPHSPSPPLLPPSRPIKVKFDTGFDFN